MGKNSELKSGIQSLNLARYQLNHEAILKSLLLDCSPFTLCSKLQKLIAFEILKFQAKK